ncbi:MAG: HK97 gp10 family phage protein [Eubacteriales bacterium]|nr:HK97 gp10 family phage protein [Eubacteriales bacterium]
MAKKTSIAGLQSEISKMLTQYAKETTDEIKGKVKEIGQQAAKELQASSPKKSGKYAKSWRAKVTEETSSNISVTVYASGHEYSLTHLLEFGHAKRGGGRVAAIEHIAPQEKQVIEKLEKAIGSGL